MDFLIKNKVEFVKPMKLNFTLKLIPFIYHETTAEENAVIIDQILSDSSSEIAFQEMMEAKEMLDTVILRPSRASVSKILAYSKGECELL